MSNTFHFHCAVPSRPDYSQKIIQAGVYREIVPFKQTELEFHFQVSHQFISKILQSAMETMREEHGDHLEEFR